jgi:branched-chain amino acid transport system permease protein
VDQAYFIQLLIGAVMLGLIYTLTALGFTLIFGISRVVNFAHGEIYMVGAFVAYALVSYGHLPTFVAVILAAAVVAVLGVVLEFLLYRPIRPKQVGTVDELPTVMISVALIYIIPAVVILIAGTTERALPHFIAGSVTLGGAIISNERLLIVAIGLAVFVGLLFFIWRHRDGRAMVAISQDTEAALLQGVSHQRIISLSFGLGFGLAAIAGALLAPLYFIDTHLGPAALLKTVIVVILGGIGSVPGTILGGLILGFIDVFGQAFLGGSLPTLVAFALVMFILIIRPRGLLGHD